MNRSGLKVLVTQIVHDAYPFPEMHPFWIAKEEPHLTALRRAVEVQRRIAYSDQSWRAYVSGTTSVTKEYGKLTHLFEYKRTGRQVGNFEGTRGA